VLIGLFLLLAKMVHDAHRRQPMTGIDEMMGAKGVCSKKIARHGEVILQGVRWQARSESVIEKGQAIRVIKLDGLVLVVTEDKER
jgi:membrane-bound serine protease (ClpP class)